MNFSKSELLSIGIKKRNKETNMTWQEINIKYTGGFFKDGEETRMWVKNQLRNKNVNDDSIVNNNHEMNRKELKDELIINKDGSQNSFKTFKLSEIFFEKTKSLDYILELHGYDKNEWVVITAKSNCWEVYSKQDQVTTLFATRVSVKPKEDVENEVNLQKKKIQLQDQRREYNDLIRKEAKFEHLKEEIHKSILELSKQKSMVFEYKIHKPTNVRANVIWADWHYGCSFKNSLNEYNPEIFRKRIQKLINETIQYGKMHNIDTLTVANIGDAISGLIHISTRVQASEDLIQQIQVVSEVMAESLAELSKHFRLIRFINIIGNHSRLQSDKTAALLNENMEKLIPWFIKSRLKDFKNIDIYEDSDGYFVDETFEPQHVYLHGDLDQISSAVKNISQLLGITPSYVFGGHIHHQTTKEFGRTKVITGSSLMGVDDYAISKRFYAEPMQLMHIFNDLGKIEYQIPIYLN